MAINEEFQKEA